MRDSGYARVELRGYRETNRQKGDAMDLPPPTMPSTPQRVSIADSAADRDSAKAFHRMIEQRYKALRNDLAEGEDVILEYHTPAGDRIVLNQITHPRNTDVLIYQGHGVDGSLCQVLTRSSSLHLLFRIVALPEEAPERSPIGFR